MIRLEPELLILLFVAALLGLIALSLILSRWREWRSIRRWQRHQRICPTCTCLFESGRPDGSALCPGCDRLTSSHQRPVIRPGQLD